MLTDCFFNVDKNDRILKYFWLASKCDKDNAVFRRIALQITETSVSYLIFLKLYYTYLYIDIFNALSF